MLSIGRAILLYMGIFDLEHL